MTSTCFTHHSTPDDALIAQIAAMKPFHGDAEPGVLARLAHRRAEEAAQIREARASADELSSLRRDLQTLRRGLRLARLEYALKANFDPDQPRDEYGRWTDGGGEGEAPPVELIADDSLAGEPIDLRDEEINGGHTIERHVNQRSETLIDYVKRSIAADPDPRRHGIRSGSFPSLEAANRLVNSTINRNRPIVDAIARGLLPEQRVDAYFASPTGIEAYARTIRSQPIIRDTFGVGVYIRRDVTSSRGYRVITAYPRNRY